MGRRFQSLMKDHGLGDIGSGEGRLIYLLWRAGPLRQGELAAKAGIDKSTLALTLARMEKKGLVERDAASGDGRGVVVTLSESASLRAPAFESVSAAMGQDFYLGLTGPEIAAFEKALERILGNLA
jgi:DNA-binding MarR family transcriptional regulator